MRFPKTDFSSYSIAVVFITKYCLRFVLELFYEVVSYWSYLMIQKVTQD